MDDSLRTRLVENLSSVREQILTACDRAGRPADQVTLVAVTKYADLEHVRELVELGVSDLGESRPQQLAKRAQVLPGQISWHMIGHLQRNKADDVMAVARLIHSVDSVRLFDHLANCARKRNRPQRILLEVNVSGETSKDGFPVDELLGAWPRLQTCETLQIAGLMTMAPLDQTPEASRPVFRKLRELRDLLSRQSEGRLALHDLSMGMSGDFEVAIEEGATHVRIGSRLFEGLPSTMSQE